MNALDETRADGKLRLSGLAQTLDVRLQEAAGHSLNHAEFLELILQDELAVREDRPARRGVSGRRLPRTQDPGGLRLAVQHVRSRRKQVYDLATCQFIRESRECCCSGRRALARAILCQAIGYQAIKVGLTVLYRSIFDVVRDFLHDEAFGGEEKVLAKYLKPDLLIVDDMGMKQLPKRSGEYLFEIIMRRYETGPR